MSENKNRGPHQARNKPFPQAGTLSNGAEKATSDPILGESISNADERKTVILDEDLEGLEFEDKAWLYWKRNKNFIITLIAVTFCLIIGIQGWKVYQKDSFNSLASAYEKAVTLSEREAFAQANAGTAIAGVALLQNADALYQSKDYAKAETAYKAAQKSLDGQVLLGRAMLGQAMSLVLLGKTEDGKKLLEAISADNSLDASYRAESAYNTAMLEISANNTKAAKAILEKLVSAKDSAYWAQTAQSALDSID